MEGPLEVKDSAPNAEEPIKLETRVQSPASSDRSDGAASPPPNCSICLGKLVNTSFTDSCLHQFCFTCLLQWSKIKTECPLCKQTFKSIIHNVRSEEDYDQYHCPREIASQVPPSQVMATFDLNFEVDGHFDVGIRRFFYRTTMTGSRRQNSILNPEPVARREQLPSIAPQVSREERRRRRTNPFDYRRTVYRHGIWSAPLPDMFGRFRECSAEYYRRVPRELNRLIPWLTRELEVLLSNSASHIAYVLNLILEGLTQYDIRSSEFRDLVRPHLGVHTEHFAHELYTYARSNFDLVGYDESVTYLPQGLSNELVSYAASPPSSSSSSSDDSSIRLLDDSLQLPANSTMPNVGPHSINMPGPSTLAQAFSIDPPMNVPDVLVISSSNSSSSDDECEVIGYVKPRHERTPEIIELSSSDPEEISSIPNERTISWARAWTELERFTETSQPSTSHVGKRGPNPAEGTDAVASTNTDSECPVTCSKKRIGSTENRICSSSDSDSDSDSTCSWRRDRCRYCHENRGKKSSKRSTNTKKHDTKCHARGSRNRSSSGESESRKRKSRKSTLRSAKRRLSSSSRSRSPEVDMNRTDSKSRSNTRYSTRGTVRVRKDLVKSEDKYTSNESSSSDSSSDNASGKINSYAVRKTKRKYISSSSEYDAGTTEKPKRLRSVVERVVSKESRQRSSSESSYDSRCSLAKDVSRQAESSSRSKTKVTNKSSSDSDNNEYRPNSQNSHHSSNSQSKRKQVKHKDRYKSKERKHSASKIFCNAQSTSSTVVATSSTLPKHDTNLTTKHSDSKSSSSSKGKHKSHKSHKESKHRRSQHEIKSKSRKRTRYVRSSSSSDSE